MEITRYRPTETNYDRTFPVYVSTVGTSDEKAIYRPSGIDNNMILYTAEGEGTAYIGGRKYELSKRSVLFLPAKTTHFYERKSPKWRTYWVSFGGSVDFFGVSPSIWNIPEDFDFIGSHNEVFKHSQSPKNSVESSVALYSLLVRCKEFADRETTTLHRLNGKMDKATDWIYDRFTENFEISEAAAVIGVSAEHFCRMCKEYTGKRPFEYVTELRIERAKSLIMSDSEKSISEIAAETGYSDTSYFIRKFRSFEGISPGKYRKNFAERKKYLKNP